MRFKLTLASVWLLALCAVMAPGEAFSKSPSETQPTFKPAPDDPLRDVREDHLRNVRQLTFGGENAEAYFSPDGKRLVLQRRTDRNACDQIYVLDIASGRMDLVSSGEGRTTCAYFYPDGKKLLYASTHAASPDCPTTPPFQRGRYVWPVFASYDIFLLDPAGGKLRNLTRSPGYDAEATLAPDGSRIVFTSTRDGDLELYSMALDGSDVRRLTRTPGYDGGAFYSPDSKRIVYRASRPEKAELKAYERLLAEDLVEPKQLEIFVMQADGSGQRQVTSNGAANFCPYFTPDGRRIIFSSNYAQKGGRYFDLHLVNDDGTGLERVTFHPAFDGFPMFSPDGKKLVWGSNRNAKERGDTNIFIADWVETPAKETAGDSDASRATRGREP